MRIRSRPRLERVMAVLIAVSVAASFTAAAPTPLVAKGSPRNCSNWSSLTQPPPTIRVLRRKSGRIEVVNFRRYVITVMGKEWPSYLPLNVVAAGAVAVKQYAWYHSMYSSRAANGRCFDVRDSTGDQLYKPNRSRVRPDHYAALDMTWHVTLRKHGRFFMTGYRRGNKVRCGRDVTGYKLFARSAVRCAQRGWGWREILRKYYGPGVDIVGDGGGAVVAPGARARNTGTRNNGTSSGASARTPGARWAEANLAPATARAPDAAAPSIRDSREASSLRATATATATATSAATATATSRSTRLQSGLGGSLASLWLLGGAVVLIGAIGHGQGWLGVLMTGRRRQRVGLVSASDSAAVTRVQARRRRSGGDFVAGSTH